MNRGSLLMAAQMLGIVLPPPEFYAVPPPRRRGHSVQVNGSHVPPLAARVGGKPRKQRGKKGGRQ